MEEVSGASAPKDPISAFSSLLSICSLFENRMRRVLKFSYPGWVGGRSESAKLKPGTQDCNSKRCTGYVPD